MTAVMILCKCGWASAVPDAGWGIQAGKDWLLDEYNDHKKRNDGPTLKKKGWLI